MIIYNTDLNFFKLENFDNIEWINVNNSPRKECFMAWEEGLKLAHNLGIEIDLKLWHNFVKKNLFDYVKWAYDPDKFHAETI